jgi:hypothetical protein
VIGAVCTCVHPPDRNLGMLTRMPDPIDANRLEPETSKILNEINGLRQLMRGGIAMPDCDGFSEAQCLEKMKALLRAHAVERGSVLWKAALRDVRRDCATTRLTKARTL